MWVPRQTDPVESVPDVALVTCHAPVGDRCLGAVLGGDDQFSYITTVHVVVKGQAVHLLCTSEKEIFFKRLSNQCFILSAKRYKFTSFSQTKAMIILNVVNEYQ